MGKSRTSSSKAPLKKTQSNPKSPPPTTTTTTTTTSIEDLFCKKKEKKQAIKQQEETQAKEKQQRKDKHKEEVMKAKLAGDRSDVKNLTDEAWVDDGLGGIFNKDGFTGRKDEGMKIYKAHLMNERNFGNTPDCPFDCKCCYI